MLISQFTQLFKNKNFRFARFWVYAEIQSSMNDVRTLKLVQLPYEFNIPKRLQKSETYSFANYEKKQIKIDKTGEEIETEQESPKNNYILPLEVKIIKYYLFNKFFCFRFQKIVFFFFLFSFFLFFFFFFD